MDEKKLYARAHKAVEDILPSLKGETLTREQFWKLLNINPNYDGHIPFKKAINDVLWNLSQQNKKKKIVKLGSRFKVVDDDLSPIDFKKASGKGRFDLVLPLGIHKYCYLYRKNIGILFGSKDAGKSAWCFNIAALNMNKHRTIYWSSEMVEDELRNRLSKHNGLNIEDWKIEAYERSYDFHEVVDPDALNIIDYLEMGGDDAEYYKCVAFIRYIYNKLQNGVAIIALQKNKDAQLPKGGSGALEKARLAISLDPNKATLVVAKNWAEGITSSPRGKSWTYQLAGGINIANPIEANDEEL